MDQVKGKWALITGAARDIGFLTARFMAGQGCNLGAQHFAGMTMEGAARKAEAEFDSPY